MASQMAHLAQGRAAPGLRPFTAKGTRVMPRLARTRIATPWVIRSQDMDSEALEEIDPITGQVVAKNAASNPVAGYRVIAGGLEVAYRTSQPNPEKADASKPAVLLLHGIGSSSYSYRNMLGLLGADGYEAYAPDWVGHGDSDKPAGSKFDYSERAYTDMLSSFVQACGIRKPFALVVQGFVLSQYGLLWALENEELVQRLLVLNTPVGLSSKLRPDLAAYKSPIPFMRPGSKPFDGAMFNADGSPYMMDAKTAEAYARPYQEAPAASQAISLAMDKVNFPQLVKKVDEGYQSWRKPSVLMFGGSDPFVSVKDAFEFLESKRTNMKCVTPDAKVGHMPQEDFAEGIHDTVKLFLEGKTDSWTSIKTLKMTKKGAVNQ